MTKADRERLVAEWRACTDDAGKRRLLKALVLDGLRYAGPYHQEVEKADRRYEERYGDPYDVYCGRGDDGGADEFSKADVTRAKELFAGDDLDADGVGRMVGEIKARNRGGSRR
jgi:hypothetical protein